MTSLPLLDEVTMELCDVLPLEGVLRLENAPGNDQPALAMVPILYTDLPGVDHEPITLFADSTTTAGYVGVVCVCVCVCGREGGGGGSKHKNNWVGWNRTH